MRKHHGSDRLAPLAADALCVAFLASIVAAANGLHLFYLLFPELAALASDVFNRPQGKWARVPWKLVATPSATALIGVAVGRWLPYDAPSILLVMTVSILVIYALRSSVAPAISAGVLPIVLGVRDWRYAVCIPATLLALAALLLVWRATPYGKQLSPDRGSDRRAIEVLERVPRPGPWLAAEYLFVLIFAIAAQATGLRFLLFPPLIVIAFEMLGHPRTCPWALAPLTFPVVCSAAALFGVGMVQLLGVTPLAAAVTLVLSMAACRIARLRMPPVLAIGLIPFVIVSPTAMYAASVAIGTCGLTLFFIAYRLLDARLAVRAHRAKSESSGSPGS